MIDIIDTVAENVCLIIILLVVFGGFMYLIYDLAKRENKLFKENIKLWEENRELRRKINRSCSIGSHSFELMPTNFTADGEPLSEVIICKKCGLEIYRYDGI